MAILPKLIYRFKTTPINTPAIFFVKIDKLTLIFIWAFKRPRIAKITLKKNKVGKLTLPNFKTYYKPTVIKTMYKDKHID